MKDSGIHQWVGISAVWRSAEGSEPFLPLLISLRFLNPSLLPFPARRRRQPKPAAIEARD